MNYLLWILGVTLSAWLFLWRKAGDRWGELGMLNSWAEWGERLLWVVGILAVARKQRGAGLAIVGLALWSAVTAWEKGLQEPLPVDPVKKDTVRATFTVMSANLFKKSKSVARHIDLIRRYQPDVICFQELSPQFCDEFLTAVGNDYPYRVLRPEKGSYGAGVISKYPIEETGFWDKPGIKPWGQRVQLTLPDDVTVELYNVHLLPPTADYIEESGHGWTWSFRSREAQMTIMQEEIAARGQPAAILGDHNFSDTNDTYRIATRTLTDSWVVAGQGVRYTWPTQAFPTKRVLWQPRMLRIDYCFHNEKLATVDMKVLTERTGSDHTPLFVTLAVTA